MKTATRVDTAQHSATTVGDEALLLARHAPTWVYPKRIVAGHAAIQAGANILLCDDALQHHALKKDINILVIDGAFGIGNGHLLPAGPLRESFASATKHAHAIILIGEDVHGVCNNITLPVFHAALNPVGDVAWLKNTPVVAFAGIARPEKFYATLRTLGANITHTHDFPDHHPFSEEELKRIALGGTLVTTEKDWVRLSPEWQARCRYVPVALEFSDICAVSTWLSKTLHA